ncbi:MAG: thiolase family protein [bacterium]
MDRLPGSVSATEGAELIVRKVYILGSYMTQFKKWPERTFKDLVREAYLGALEDAGWADGAEIEFGWFSNMGMHAWKQASIRGQVCFIPLVREGLFPQRVPIINVEGACASGSCALYGAWQNILSGQHEVTLALGVEKLIDPNADPEKKFALFSGGTDALDFGEQLEVISRMAQQAGTPLELGPGRSPAMDIYAIKAAYHMRRHGTTQRQIAMAASKAHGNGALNPKAQYRFPMSVDEVLADRLICYPLTRAMCAPMSDGAAAAILCSEDYLKGLPSRAQSRAVRINAVALKGGKNVAMDEPTVTRAVGQAAFRMAGVGPQDIGVVEAHDACSFSEIFQPEMLGFCGEGQGGRLVESGATRLEGKIPWNPSGGLVSKGHPIGATGLSMIYEIVTQLRGEAGERQVQNRPELGLIDNGGGVIFLDEAICGVTILQKDR